MGLDLKGSSSGSSPVLNLSNLALRVLQAILAAAVIGVYASEYHTLTNTDYYYIRSKFWLAVTVGSLSLITAVVFAIIPFLLSYRVVAFACLWELILFFIWTATFAYMKHYFPWGKAYADLANSYKQNVPDFEKLQDAVWIDLVNMLLWLISTIFSVVMIFIGRRSGGSRTRASYV